MAEDNDTENTSDDKAPAKPAKSVKSSTKKKAAKIENPSLPKDRNARVREQAARKLAEAQGRPVSAAGGLSTEELVDDALARGFSKVMKWAKANLRYIEGGAVVLVLVGAGYAIYDWQFNKRLERASDALAKGLRDISGRVVTDDQSKINDPDEVVDPRPKFPSAEARREAVLSDFRLASTQYAGTGAAILAKLGEAGALLDRKEYDAAVNVYREVLATQLAKADLGVLLSATEGLGMALEGKGDFEGALDAYRKLEGSKEHGFQELGMYHQARLLLSKKNERDIAKDLLIKAKQSLTASAADQTPGSGSQPEFLANQINGVLREIDPTLAPAPTSGGNFNQMSIEQLMRQKRQIEALRKAANQQPTPPAPAPMPLPSSSAP